MPDLGKLLKQIGVTAEELARRASVSPERISELKRKWAPTIEELTRIAEALGMGEEDVLRAREPESQTAVMFRRSLPKKAEQEHWVANRLALFTERAVSFIDTRSAKDSWAARFKGPFTDVGDAEKAAVEFRVLFFGDDQHSPLTSLPQIVAEELGVYLFLVQNTPIDGASASVHGNDFVFVSAQFPPRMLFTLAHEVGHLILHSSEGSDSANTHWENSIGTGRWSNRREERFANAFAASLLLPKPAVGMALRTVRRAFSIPDSEHIGDIELLYLAHFFGVSFQVAAHRCEELTLLPKGGAASIYEHLCKHFRSPEQRAKALGVPERTEIQFPTVPPRLVQILVRQIQAGTLSVGKAAETLGRTTYDLVEVNSRFLS